MSPRLPIVDADGHVDEVHVDWQQRLPKKFAAAAPQLRHETDGSFRLYMEGNPAAQDWDWEGRLRDHTRIVPV